MISRRSPVIIEWNAERRRWQISGSKETVWNSLPSVGRVEKECHAKTPEEAMEKGAELIRAYEQNSYPGGLGQLLGIVRLEDGEYAPVVSTYYSPS